MLDPILILAVFLIWLLTFLISLTKNRLRRIVIKNALFALLYTSIIIAISIYIDGRESMIYNLFALILLGIHSICILIYTLFVALFRTEIRNEEI